MPGAGRPRSHPSLRQGLWGRRYPGHQLHPLSGHIKNRRQRPVHLVICGKQAVDGDTGQTGPGIATRLGFNQFTYVSEIMGVDPERNTITVKREIEGGAEVIEGKLPALLTAELELNTIRYASLPELVRSLRQTVMVWGAKELGGLPERLGLKGSPTSVKEIFAPPVREGGLVFGSGQNSERVVEDFLDTFFEKEKRLLDGLLLKDNHA